MPRYIGAYRGGVRPSAPTTVYRICALSLPCHSHASDRRHWRGNPFPFSYQRRPWPPPTFAAKRQRRDLIIANPRRVFPKREGRSPPSLVAQGRGIFKGEGRPKLPSPLNGVLWILSFAKERKYPAGGIPRRGAELPCLSGKKATRRRQKRKKKPRPYAPSTDNLCVYVTGRTESSSPTRSPNPLRIRHTHKKRRPPAGGLPVLYLYITPPSRSVHSRRCCGDRPRRRCSSRCCGTRRTSAPADSSAK